MSFRVGQKVCCIKDGKWKLCSDGMPGPPIVDGPQKGDIVTIERIEDSYGDIVWLFFAEHKNIGAFDARFFRPIVDRPTSIAIFNKMLLNDEQRNRSELERLNEERGAPMELPFQ